ncbi:MAG: M48 family metalloprotease [Pseudomonadota bacterium]
MSCFFSDGSRGRRLLAAVVAVCLLVASAPESFGAFFSHFSPEEERKLGDKLLVEVRERYGLIDDPVVVSYINAVGAHLVEKLGYKTFPYHFYVVNSEILNAFAAPGGHIFVFSGLLTRLNSEGELASILSHEIGHVSCNHLAKRMSRGTKIGLATLAMVLAGAFLGGGGEASQAASMSGLAAGASLSLKFDRKDEEEADRVGLKLLRGTGYDGNAAVNALRTIYRFRWYGSDEVPTYLSTHPDMGQRISYLEDMLLASPAAAPPLALNPLDFKKVQTRLLASCGDPKLCLARFEGVLLQKTPPDFLGTYGLGLAYRRQGRYAEAQAALEKALALQPTDNDVLRDLGVCYFEAGKNAEAAGALRKVLAAHPDDTAAAYYMGRASQESGDLDAAIDCYRKLLGGGLETADIHDNLGLVYAKKGDMASAHYHTGMAFKLRGDMEMAAFHLRDAEKLCKGKPEEEKVRSALKECQEEIDARHKEKAARPGGQPPRLLPSMSGN